MSPETKLFAKEIQDIRNESDRCKDDVIALARLLPMTLKDRGCAATASELEAKLFILDATVSKMTDLIKRPDGIERFIELISQRPHE